MSWFNKNRNKMEYEDRNTTAFVSSQYGGIASQNEAVATEEMRQGMALLRDAAVKAGGRPVDKAQGNLFEYIEAAKFNSAAARQGSSLRARLTEAMGRPHDAADAEILDGSGKVLQKVQYKSFGNGKGSISRQVSGLRNPKYNKMQRVVNKENTTKVNSLLDKAIKRKGNIYSDDYQDVKDNLSQDGTSFGSVKTNGTTHAESTKAVEKTKTYTAMMNTKQGLREAGVTAGQAAIGGGIVGGAISSVKNGIAVYNGQITTKDAIIATTKDTGKSGLRAGVSGGLGSLIRQGAAKVGAKTLAKSNVATAVASATIETGVVVYDWVRGEINSEEAIIKVGQNTTSTVSGLYAGAAAGAVFGPAGAVIGSVVGYMIASNIYQSCVTIFENAKLSEAEAARVIALYEEAAKEMRNQREEFEKYVRNVLNERHNEFAKSFELIDKGLYCNSPELTTYALAQFADLVGANLKLATFKDFDDFMMNSDNPLSLK